jgi:hypothetical protein
MKIKQNFVIVCDSTIVEKDTNNLSLIGIFDSVHAPKVPMIHSKFCVVTNFEGDTGQHKHKIIIKKETGEEVVKLEGPINFGDEGKAQHIGRFFGTRFPVLGRYIVEIYLDDEIQPLNSSIKLTP